MPAVARANAVDAVLSPNGTGYKCRSPLTVATGSSTHDRVFSQGSLIVLKDDIVMPHSLPGCTPIDVQTLSTYSSRVFAVGRNIGRIGDLYGDNVIISGSPRVFSN